jgi:uncharacterized damage-inducible protein DinB
MPPRGSSRRSRTSPGREQVDRLLALLDTAYDHHAWHGPNLRGSIRGLSLGEAVWRPAAGRHNIWELIVHAAYWKYIGLRRLTGQPRASFAFKGSNWFARPQLESAAALKTDVAELESSHRALRAAVAALPPAQLDVTPRGSTVSTFTLIAGVAAHDVYHAGQIQLLKRLYRDRIDRG